MYKPIVKAQEEVKEAIDKKQDKLLEQLQKNQKALTSGLEDILMFQQLPDEQPQETTKLPIGYEPAMMEKPQFKSDIDVGFDKDEMQKLIDYELYPPSDVLKASIDGILDIDNYDKLLGMKIKKLGIQKGQLSTTKKNRKKIMTKLRNYQRTSSWCKNTEIV